MNTTACRIIDALGGTSAVARKAHAPISTVHSWRKNGIPASRLAHLELISKAEGTDISDLIEAAKLPFRPSLSLTSGPESAAALGKAA
jgi:hypothetical protein